jgi:hypothetical protein
MDPKQLERASYMAAHAILSANTGAPHLATPGARRSHMIDTIAQTIQNVFELHCSVLDESASTWYMKATSSKCDVRDSGVRVLKYVDQPHGYSPSISR